ncbi:hypothetical protein Bca4012_052321 [Brassica carinata]
MKIDGECLIELIRSCRNKVQVYRSVRMPQLHTSLHFHLTPIGRRTHAFSSYPLRTWLPSVYRGHDNSYTTGASFPVLVLGKGPLNALTPTRIWTELSHDVLNPAHSSSLLPLHSRANLRPARGNLCTPPLPFGRPTPHRNCLPETVPWPVGPDTRTIAKGPDTTTWIWNLHADAHDFDSHTSDLEEISRKVFSAHFGQLSIIFLWLSGMYFHGARFSNYEAWLSDPTHIGPSAQVVWPIVGQEILNGDVGGGFRGIQITSGFFQLWRASGITSELQLYCTAIGALVFAALMLFAGWFHYHKAAPKLAWFQDVESMLNHHLAGLLGLGSLSLAGHQVHVSLPINQFLNAGVDPKEIPLPHEFILNRDLLAQLYPSFAEGATPFFTLNWSKYSDFLTFRGGLDPVTGGLWLTDTAHHHLAIAILFLIAGHMYRTNWGIGHGLKDILEAHKGPFTGQGHKGLYEILTTSWHAQLSLNLAMLGSLTIVVAHHMYSMPPYPYLATDYATQLSLFTHHMWIGGFLIVGAAACSHFYGFHSFGLYIHNDTMSALGRPQDMFSDTAIQLQPVFAQWIQNTHALAPGVTAPGETASTSLTWGGGVLFGGSSALIPDKANLGFRFPCDGPGRGGTCQVSAWDHVFLGLFWMYNSISVVIFHFSWKMQSDVWGSISDQGVVTHITGGNFAQSSITINGWLPISYGHKHLSGRGYWQELIESIVWAHNKLKVAPATQPRALSIVQGRAVGVTHYLLGGIATTWAFFLARIIAVG